MKIAETSIGEIYQALDVKEIKDLGKYIENNYSTKLNVIPKLHKKLVELKKEKALDIVDSTILKDQVFNSNKLNATLWTTYVNQLSYAIKEFIVLSSMNKSNAEIDAIWSQFLINKKLKRNLKIVINNFEIDQFKSENPLLRKFYHHRNVFFYKHYTIGKSDNQPLYFPTLDIVKSFQDYSVYVKLENFKSLISFSKLTKNKLDDKYHDELMACIDIGINSDIEILKIQSLKAALEIFNEEKYYFELKELFIENSLKIYENYRVTIAAILLNYSSIEMYKGNESFSKDIFIVLNELYYTNSIYASTANPLQLLINLIIFELNLGTADRAQEILEESTPKLPEALRENYRLLCEARIALHRKDYDRALLLAYQGTFQDYLVYYLLFKSTILMVFAVTGEEARFQQERENLYKYLYNTKDLPALHRDSYTLFHKHIELMQESRYRSLSMNLREKLRKQLADGSPYFANKEWMRSRQVELDEMYPKVIRVK